MADFSAKLRAGPLPPWTCSCPDHGFKLLYGFAGLTLAEWLCRTADRIGRAGMSGPLLPSRGRICSFSNRTHATTTTSERMVHWKRMRRSLAKFSELEASNHTPSSADFTTTTPELKFSVHTRSPTKVGDVLLGDALCPSLHGLHHDYARVQVFGTHNPACVALHAGAIPHQREVAALAAHLGFVPSLTSRGVRP